MSFDWADMSYQERRRPASRWCSRWRCLLVFLILAAQYESWGLPFSVLLGTPFAAFGAYLGLWLARQYSEKLREQRVRAESASSC
jgi:HAE1 family hydrophobic/amphiphilic exporter-1